VTVPAPAGAGGRPQQLLSIGEMLAVLRPEFPDTTISKLRFLETEGLVEPQRTASGYRKYSREDLARLRFILAAQRDHYLPLRVIRQQLEEGLHLVPVRPTLVAVSEPADPYDDEDAGYEVAVIRLPRAQLCEQARISDDLLTELEKHGLVTARVDQWYDANALAIAQVAGQLAEYGLQPRHLRAHRLAADREISLFAQVVAPLLRQQDPHARSRAAETVRELTVLTGRLHAALLRAGLADELGQ
jgi:DNA-binding transcriptional MerR regulator